MALTNAGVEAMLDAITGIGSFTEFNAANAYIGIGDSTDVFDKTETDLQAATNKSRKPMDTGFPTQPTALTFKLQATWGTADANHAWEEWGVFNGSSGGVMLSRKVETITGSPKTGSEAWQFTVTLTIDNP